MTERLRDLWVAIQSDQPTLKRYRDIRMDRRILEHLIHDE